MLSLIYRNKLYKTVGHNGELHKNKIQEDMSYLQLQSFDELAQSLAYKTQTFFKGQKAVSQIGQILRTPGTKSVF